MIRDISGNDFEEELELALSNILLNCSESLKQMLDFFSLLDTPKIETAQSQAYYSIGKRKINIINTSEELASALKLMNSSPFIGFDSEQKPTFKKGEKSNGIALIQLANESNCYIIQIKQIKDISPLRRVLEDDNIIKIGTGLKGDKQELYNQFKIKLKATIDLEDILKNLSSHNVIGAKRAASIFLNQNLQKSKKMSTSNWENNKLSDGQIKYAVEDAAVVYDIVIHLLKQYPFILKTLPTFFQEKL